MHNDGVNADNQDMPEEDNFNDPIQDIDSDDDEDYLNSHQPPPQFEQPPPAKVPGIQLGGLGSLPGTSYPPKTIPQGFALKMPVRHNDNNQ
jgi:hypothetical protein